MSTEKAKILILGAYHFDPCGGDLVNGKIPDVLLPEKQAEIAEFVEKLVGSCSRMELIEQQLFL